MMNCALVSSFLKRMTTPPALGQYQWCAWQNYSAQYFCGRADKKIYNSLLIGVSRTKAGRLNEPPCPIASFVEASLSIYLQCASTTSKATRNSAQNLNQDTRANEGDDDRSKESTFAYVNQACQKATNERPDDANDDITDDTVATSAHN
jgi:hypothetical protein